MAAAPRCPAPLGSSGDGPIGSWTTASSAKRPSHALRSLAATANWDLRASSRAFTADLLYDTFCPELTARLMIVVAGARCSRVSCHDHWELAPAGRPGRVERRRLTQLDGCDNVATTWLLRVGGCHGFS